MIEFKVTESELKELAVSFPNFQLVLNALKEHSEIKLIVDRKTDEKISKKPKDKVSPDN